MENKKKGTDLEILFAAAAAGLTGELLFVDAGWGLGATLWVIGLGAVGLALKGGRQSSLTAFIQVLFIPLIVLALCLGWRDALFLKIATGIGLVTLLCLVMQSSQAVFKPEKARAVPGLFSTGLRSFFGFSRYLKSDVDWYALNSRVDRATTKSVVKSLLIATPCLFIFGILLSSADKKFGSLLGDMITIDVFSLPGKLFSVLLYALVAGVFLYGSLARLKERQRLEDKSGEGLSMLEAGIILGLINVMFATFVIMQLGYLFGGISYIEGVANISLKQYTRKGFFELVTVAALALPMLMALQHHFKPARKEQNIHFKIFAGVQIGLLIVMLISAAQRMYLYTHSFGITELRFYSSGFMVWIAFVLGWFGWTALRGLRLEFVRGSALAGVIMVVGLNIINPDAMIVKTNLDRVMQGVPYDEDSIRDFSADAIPVAIKALPYLPERERSLVLNGLNRYPANNKIEGWRDWTYSKHVADAQIKDLLFDFRTSEAVSVTR